MSLSSWGTGYDTTFSVAGAGLTKDYADNNRIGNIISADSYYLYLNYTKGDEDGIEIRREFNASDGSGNDYFLATEIDASTNVAEEDIIQFTSSGKYRLFEQCSLQERFIKVSVRALASSSDPPYSGTSITLTFTPNNQRQIRSS